MKWRWRVRLAAGMIGCLVFSSIPIWSWHVVPEGEKGGLGIIAYASSSNAKREDSEALENQEGGTGIEYKAATSSDAEEILELENDLMLMSAGGESQASVGTGVDGAYSSIAEVLEALTNDTGILTIRLVGDTEDQEDVVIPRDKGIERVIVCGDDNYQIGSNQPVNLVANGIPMTFEAGHVKELVGGGWNAKVPSSDLTVTGGIFHYCTGGGSANQPDVDARVTGTVQLTFDGMVFSDGKAQIYTAGRLHDNCSGAKISAKESRLVIRDSEMELDMIMGGGFVMKEGTSAELEKSDILIENSHLILGDGLCGTHAFEGTRQNFAHVDCGSVNIEIYGSVIEGDVLGGADATYDGHPNIDRIRIYAENSNMASIQAGGVYQGSFHFEIGKIDVILDSCTVNGTHWFTEEFSMIGAGCYVGEERENPLDDQHVKIGSIQYTFLNSVKDEEEDEGVEGLLLLPQGFGMENAVVSVDQCALNLNSETELLLDGGSLDELNLEPPEGYRFTSVQIDGNEVERDEMDQAVVYGIESGSEIVSTLESVIKQEQPPMEIKEASGGTIRKTIGEPDFKLTVAGGEESLTAHFTSSNPSVAEVDSDGRIIMKKTGKTQITAMKESIAYERQSVTIELVVEEPAADLIPEQQPEDTGYVLVAKKVTPDIQEEIDKEVTKREEFDEKTEIVTMEIQLIDVKTGEKVEGEGASFTIPYPLEEMKNDPDRYEVYILHIPADKAAYYVPYEKTEFGFKISVDNLSPFVIGYRQVEKTNGEDEPEDHKPEHTDSSLDSGSGGELTGRWVLDSNGWWYHYSNGTYPSAQWALLPYQGVYNWYFFNAKGYMEDGWLDWNGDKYFLHQIPDGRRGSMYTGWHQIDGGWYYFNEESGSRQGAWIPDRKKENGA